MLLHLRNTSSFVCADRCALLQTSRGPSCFRNLPSTRNDSSRMPFLSTSIWFQLLALLASDHLAVCGLDSCEVWGLLSEPILTLTLHPRALLLPPLSA